MRQYNFDYPPEVDALAEHLACTGDKEKLKEFIFALSSACLRGTPLALTVLFNSMTGS